MDDVRRGKIAYAYLRHKLSKEGIRLTPNLRRQIGNTAKAIGISPEEAMEFAEDMVRGLVEEAFKDYKRN